jgi:hypothetical protein
MKNSFVHIYFVRGDTAFWFTEDQLCTPAANF